MVRNFFVVSLMAASLLVFSAYLPGGDAKAGESTVPRMVKTISFKGGNCKFQKLDTSPMFAPAGMKEGEKAFIAQLKCVITGKSSDDALHVLYDKGKFVAPGGKHYKAGAATTGPGKNDYSLVVAVPQNVDVGKLQFVYDGQALPLGK